MYKTNTPVNVALFTMRFALNTTAIAGVVFLLSTILSATAHAGSPDQLCDGFMEDTLSGWSEKDFVGSSDYELVSYHDKQVLKATTDSQASVLYKRRTVDIRQTPWLNWSWKVDQIYPDINEQTRAGDDFPARLYVLIQVGYFPWETLIINYVWSSSVPLDVVWENPYTNKSYMVAVQSGDDHVGEWVHQRRNVAEDFKSLFGRTVNRIHGYAVMIDGDNSGQKGTAYFGGINFSAK